ncbi:MAG: DUF3592 domain-containing protein [Desulfobacterales bacterium]|nr:DUF3592 domain-containing protein [Desulfobacterales bacterium]
MTLSIYEYRGVLISYWLKEQIPIHVYGENQGRKSEAVLYIEDGKVKEIKILKVKDHSPLNSLELKNFETSISRKADSIVQSCLKNDSDSILVTIGVYSVAITIGLPVGILAFCLIVLATLESSRVFIYKGQSYFWPDTDGIIVKSYVSSYSASHGKVYTDDEIFYKYAVNGVTYTKRHSNNGIISSNGIITPRKLVAEYPVGKRVTVYYNSGDPEISFIERITLSALSEVAMPVSLLIVFIVSFITLIIRSYVWLKIRVKKTFKF